MPWTKGTVRNLDELSEKIIEYVTDESIHGDYTWELKRNLPWPMGVIFKCPREKEGEHFYIGLMTNKIKVGKTYKDWFFNEKVYSSYFLWQQSNISNVQWKSSPEIFVSDAHVMHFNIFKQYDEHLQWHEQPVGIDLTNTRCLKEQWKNANEYYSWRGFDLPLYPGTGCPSISTDYNGPVDGILEYWLKKGKYYFIVLIKNRDKWDCASVGLFEPYHKDEYAFPAFVTGSSIGATAFGKDRLYSSGQITPTIDTGIMFDYAPNNSSLVHSMPPYVTAARDENTCPTGVAVMLPDGTWQFLANWKQGITGINEYVCSGYRIAHYYYRTPPTRSQCISAYLRPGENDLQDFTRIMSGDESILKYKLEPLEIVEKFPDRTGALGVIPDLKYGSSPIKEYGEVLLSDEEYLVVPNIWQNRRLHLQAPKGITYSENGEGNLSPNGFLSGLASEDIAQSDADEQKITDSMNMVIKLD